MQAETGESAAAINRRRDDEEWETVRQALETGATLYRPVKLDRYYVARGNEVGGGSLSATRVRSLEAARVIENIGPCRYALKGEGADGRA